jgi:hypothetical protein
MDHDFAVRLERDLAEEKAAWDDHKKALDTGDIKAGLEAAYRLRRLDARINGLMMPEIGPGR